jgi:hypothetical protein
LARKKNKKKGKPPSKKHRKRSAREAPEEPDREAPATEEPNRAAGDDPLVFDLDADEEPTDAVERLIAETLATAEEDVPTAPDESVIDLDAGLDDDAPALPVVAPASPAVEGGGDRPTTVGGPSSVDECEATAEAAIRALIDLGPVSSPEVRDRLLAEALAHAEHKDARYRVPFAEAPAAARWKALLALLIVLVAGAITAVPPGWARPEPPAQLEPAERTRNLRIALLLQSQQVEAFRVRAQRLPTSLGELPRTLPGVRYVRSGSRAYQLIAYEADGNAIVYDSASPTPPFSELATAWASAQ